MSPNKQNLVAKHARKFNKATVHIDRKKAFKRGYRKHRIASNESSSFGL